MALYAFDGTWNKPDTDGDTRDESTNVHRFLQYYAPGDPEAQKAAQQYVEGVGTRLGHAGRVVGGLTGAGGHERVQEMVQSFAKNWNRNGPEDRTVDVIGFSRGGALALDFANRLARGVSANGGTIRPEIRFLGLWDVVPSFGLPGILVSDFNDINIGWELDVPDVVRSCYHAMAMDERRGAFNVHRLDPENDDAPRIQESWFRGVHSDIGGGNGNVERSNIALAWMLRKAHSSGLPIAIDEVRTLRFSLDAPVYHGKDPGRSQDRSILKGDTVDASAGRKLELGEEVIVQVDSTLWFDFSGILVEQGAKYVITPDPAGRWVDKNITCDARGWPSDLNRGKTVLGWLKDKVLDSHAVGLTRRVPQANWFEMVACVGTCAKPAVPVGSGQHAVTAWTCPTSGPLFFFANDARLNGFGQDFYRNNQGSIAVTVRRVG